MSKSALCANVFAAGTADQAWLQVVEAIRTPRAAQQSGRGGLTRELLHALICIEDPVQKWVTSRKPALNPAFAIAEIIWILGGRSDSGMLTFFNRQLPRFAGSDTSFHGAYGSRLRRDYGIDQLRRVADVLSSDPDSRQAVLQIWSADRDLPHSNGKPVAPDIPCNIVSLLKVRSNSLHWTQVLRSNDLVLGFPHNVVQFTALQEVIAGWLNTDLGSYTHLADSMHVYERDLSDISVTAQLFAPSTDKLGLPYEESARVWKQLEEWAYRLASADATLPVFMEAVRDRALPTSFNNLLVILVAEAARRRGFLEVMEEAACLCTNPALNMLWNGWSKRMRNAGV